MCVCCHNDDDSGGVRFGYYLIQRGREREREREREGVNNKHIHIQSNLG